MISTLLNIKFYIYVIYKEGFNTTKKTVSAGKKILKQPV